MSHQNAGNPAQVYPYSHHNKPEEHKDTLPSDYQPPVVDATPRPEEEVAEALSS